MAEVDSINARATAIEGMIARHTGAVAIENMIAGGEFNRALNAIHDTVERIVTDPITTAQAYGSPHLDALCQEIGTRLYERTPAITPQPGTIPTYVYIATKLQRAGGHTRLVRDFIFARPQARHIILLTELAGKSDHAWLAETFHDLAHYECLVAPRGNLESSLRWLQSQLIALAPTHTYLFNHHQDAVAAAAIVPAMGLAASFCHHADHQLCLGVHLSHLTHIDFHPMGYHQCRDRFGIDNRYVPLTVADHGMRPPAPFMASGSLTTCTVGGAHKLEVPYVVQYVDVIPALLAATGGKHFHIGRLSAQARSRIASGLTARRIASERFVYIPWVQSVWGSLIAHQVDFYLCSFPFGGGLSMTEAMGAGIPLTAHRHITHRALGGFDLSYPGAFSWRTVDELIGYCANLTPGMLAAQSKEARAFYERYHRADLLPSMLAADAAPIIPPPLSDNYKPEESALAAVNPRSLRYLLRRFAYRAFRRMRRRIGSSIR